MIKNGKNIKRHSLTDIKEDSNESNESSERIERVNDYNLNFKYKQTINQFKIQ